MASLTVQDIARELGGVVDGDDTLVLTGVASIREADSGDLSFVEHRRYAKEARATRASAVLVPRDWNHPCPAVLVRVDKPDEAFTRVTGKFAPPAISLPAGVHPTAVVSEEATLGEDVTVGAHCVVEAGASVGDRTVLMAGCYVGHHVSIGCDGKFYPHVSVREYSSIGRRVIVHDGSVIGSDGFGYVVDEHNVRTKVPQVGTVEIGDDVELGANVTIDRARFGKTRLGKGVKIDNLVQIAHNVVIGDHAVVVAQVGIAGSTRIGPHAIIAGQAGIAGHLDIGAGAQVLAQSGVSGDIPAGQRVFGYPAIEQGRAMSLFREYLKLPKLKARVAELERQLAERESPPTS